MKSVIGVRFKQAGKIYYFDPLDFPIKKNDAVIVETVRGMEYGTSVTDPKPIQEDDIKHPLKPVIRLASPDDILTYKENLLKEKRAVEIARQKIKEHALDMKLLDVEYTFDGAKIIFYFTAEGRIDFRDLVKDLATIFRTRIELRQIGVRDEAKMLSGIASCGRELCCASWLGDFEPVSIKMAKNQNLSLNPTKISGVCGRLMCCLNYEDATYEDLRRRMPRIGDKVLYQNKSVDVADINLLKEMVQIRTLKKDESVELLWVELAEIKRVRQEAKKEA